ncbi:MAG TPA: hypothetical protein VIQ05_01335 [Tardiphaga sp.]|jgi:hypothetical protein
MAELLSLHSPDRWLPVSVVPKGLPVEVSVIDDSGFHALVVACRWNGKAWAGVSTRKHLDIAPTHWRPWSDDRSRRNLAISRVWIRYGFRSVRS